MINTLYFPLYKLQNNSNSNSVKRNDDVNGILYAGVTLHCPSNVAHKGRPAEIIFPVNPRKRKNIEASGLSSLCNDSYIVLKPSLPYVPFLRFWKNADLVLTESGGTSTLVGTSRIGILNALPHVGDCEKGRIRKFLNGKASQRINDTLSN